MGCGASKETSTEIPSSGLGSDHCAVPKQQLRFESETPSDQDCRLAVSALRPPRHRPPGRAEGTAHARHRAGRSQRPTPELRGLHRIPQRAQVCTQARLLLFVFVHRPRSRKRHGPVFCARVQCRGQKNVSRPEARGKHEDASDPVVRQERGGICGMERRLSRSSSRRQYERARAR